jgi:hypothetical protein
MFTLYNDTDEMWLLLVDTPSKVEWHLQSFAPKMLPFLQLFLF